MTYTTSFHNGKEVSRPHNKRDKSYVKAQKHIDENGRFEVWKDVPLGLAYQNIFGDALKEYNAKQSRTDRKIKSYLQHIKNDKQKAPVYECIFQVGNEKIKPDFETSRKILKEFATGFEQRNPNFKVVGIYFHADELGSTGKGGTPHVHLDYVPVGTNFKKGLRVQNSVKKALENMGYFDKLSGKKVIETGQAQWCKSEREALTDICKRHGLTIENPKRQTAEYESSKMMRIARDKNLELSRREAVIKDKEQTAEMNLDISKFILEKLNGLKNLNQLKNLVNDLAVTNKKLKSENQTLKEIHAVIQKLVKAKNWAALERAFSPERRPEKNTDIER